MHKDHKYSTLFHNCMTWNVKTHILTISQLSITNRVLSLFDRFTCTYYNDLLYDLKCQKTHISAISVHKYHKSCS